MKGVKVAMSSYTERNKQGRVRKRATKATCTVGTVEVVSSWRAREDGAAAGGVELEPDGYACDVHTGCGAY